MNKKSRLLYGIILLCMVAILLIGQIRLSLHKESVDQPSVQGMNLEHERQIVDKFQTMKEYTMMDGDIYTDDIDENTTQLVKEEEPDQNLEVTTGEDEGYEREENRKEDAVEALNITNPKFSVDAKAAVLMNANTKEILYNKEGLELIQPASTTKLLTAIVAVEVSQEDEEFVVGSEIELIASDSSRAYLRKGQVLSLNQILDALLLPSGNDAAYTIAANLGRKISKDPSLKPKKAVKVFVQAMNDKAKELGVVSSNFKGPDGYDAKGQYTTAYDMALIGAAALEYDEIKETVLKVKARDILISGDDVTWYNANKLVKPGSGYYYKYAVGLKTGTSGEAGRCLVSAAIKDEAIFVSVVMNSSYEGRWQDSIDLLSYGIGLD